MSNNITTDVTSWTPEQRTWFCDAWTVLAEQSNGRVPDGVEGNQLEAAYQLNLLPRPPEQSISAPKHDGKLDEDGNYTVSHSYGAWGFEGIILDEGKRTAALLDPKQALSLLAWLEQEKEKLELLVKEQEA